MDWQILLDAILLISTAAVATYSYVLRERIKREGQERRSSVNLVDSVFKETTNTAYGALEKSINTLFQRLAEHEHPHEHEHIQHVHELEAASREITAGHEVTVKRCRVCGMIFRDNASI